MDNLNRPQEHVVVVDFGAQHSQLIARRIRECRVYCEILPYDTPAEELAARKPKGIVLSGEPSSVYEEGAPHPDPKIFELGIPVLEICYGMQLMGYNLGGAIVSASLPDYFYIEASDRSTGIRVDSLGYALSAGMEADIAGRVRTNSDGERYVDAATALQDGMGNIEPMLMISRGLGGGDWAYNGSAGAGQKGVFGGAGLNNIGLLVNVVGRVMFADTGNGYFYLDDGSALDDGSGHLGVKTLGTVPVGEGQDPVGKYVKVIGISSCYMPGSDLLRMIRSTEVSIVPE